MAMIESAVFGNRDGSHQLLSSSLPATTSVLDALRFLVDRPSGHIGAEVTWYPYWGCQSLERWWVLWRGEEDRSALRKNMVTARVLLAPLDRCAALDITELLVSLGYIDYDMMDSEALRLAGLVVDSISRGEGPAIIPDLSMAPLLLRTIWPRLWESARPSLSLRTLFDIESLDSVSNSSIVVIPSELKTRWRSKRILDIDDAQIGSATRYFSGKSSPLMYRLITANNAQLPGDITVFDRIERIAERLDRLHAGIGTLADALVVVRTMEAFTGGFIINPEDRQTITVALRNFEGGSANEVRMASLANLDVIQDINLVENSLSRWVEKHLPEQSSNNALWILEQQAGKAHAAWWRRAVGRGVNAGCRAKTPAWAIAIWRWWQARSDTVSLTSGYLDKSSDTEKWLAESAPASVEDELLDVIARICSEREWATLLARTLGTGRPLMACIEMLLRNMSHPEAGLEALLSGRDATEIVDTAAATCWSPLVTRAVSHTLIEPQLLARALGTCGIVTLLLRHFAKGGELPAELVRNDFFEKIFDEVVNGRSVSMKMRHLLQ